MEQSPIIEETEEKFGVTESGDEESSLRHKICLRDLVSFREEVSPISVDVKVLEVQKVAEMFQNMTENLKPATADAMVTKNVLIALEQKLYAFQELKMGYPLYSQALVVREKYPSVQFMSGTVIEDAETAKNIQILGACCSFIVIMKLEE